MASRLHRPVVTRLETLAVGAVEDTTAVAEQPAGAEARARGTKAGTVEAGGAEAIAGGTKAVTVEVGGAEAIAGGTKAVALVVGGGASTITVTSSVWMFYMLSLSGSNWMVWTIPLSAAAVAMISSYTMSSNWISAADTVSSTFHFFAGFVDLNYGIFPVSNTLNSLSSSYC